MATLKMRRRAATPRFFAAALVLALVVPPGTLFAQEPPPAPAPEPPAATPPEPAPPPAAAPAAPQAAPSPAPDVVEIKPRGWNDQRRTVKGYPSNLFYNAAGLFTRGNHGPLALGFAAVPASMLLDDEARDYFEDHPHQNWADWGAALGGTLVVGGLTVGFFSAGRIVRGGRFRAATYDVSQAILINGFYTFLLKYTIRRERPDGSDRLSFPSGHTSNAFAGATVIARHYGWKWGVPAYATATFIGTSRMAANRHHFSDVVGGGLLGYAVGRAVVRRNSRPPTPPGGPTPPTQKPPSVALWPYGGPAGDGAGLALSIAF